VIGPLVEALDDLGPWRLMLLPDHATPCVLRTHTPDPVPYLIYDPAEPGPGGVYTESGVAGCAPVPAHDLMARFLQREPAIA
jgi:2,3-bisphosphoglycerate-independent phosphoglycerate mutase